MNDVDIEKATEKFMNDLNSGKYIIERLKDDTKYDYSKEKEDRDSQAVKEFTESELFKAIIEM